MAKKKNTLLSKKNMKYLEAIVYAFLIVIVIFANTFGPFYIKMLPLLILLGAVGKIIFGRPITTSVFGMVISLCMVYMSGERNLLTNVLLSSSATLLIALGELLGEYAKKSYHFMKKHTKHISTAAIRTYIVTLIILMVGALIHIYLSGNIFQYQLAKKRVQQYIEDTYQGQVRFEVLEGSYHIIPTPHYTYSVRESTSQVVSRFTIYLNNPTQVQDGYAQRELTKEKEKMEKELQEYRQTHAMLQQYPHIVTRLEMTEENEVVLQLSKEIENLDNETVHTFAEQVNTFLQTLGGYAYYSNIQELHLVLQIKGQEKPAVATIVYMQGYEEAKVQAKDLVQYLEDSLHVEYFN